MVLDPRKLPAEPFRLIVFDLDGTLIDSRADLTHSVNAMLRYLHRPELPEDVIASYIELWAIQAILQCSTTR
jgi:phosphoglycolate phosphatase